MNPTEQLEQELSEILDKYEIGEADRLDVTIALLNLCGLANKELASRALMVLEGSLVNKKPVGKPKTITPEQITEIHELKKNGMTQEKIAQHVGISLSSVRRELKNKFQKNT